MRFLIDGVFDLLSNIIVIIAADDNARAQREDGTHSKRGKYFPKRHLQSPSKKRNDSLQEHSPAPAITPSGKA